ncbi:HtaA domain-containing protein [Streptomyces sp. ASQP_92]|uniref:HtaA domain-containing protein n=1 Tax=Streptomyces sp. ASQP_92 TaxID=2979116 RepID=UPI0021C0AD14|nr:HtaA domain-containing protein [Streptomyces sp. ASQP_92]MCT9091616.1 HtaA domain-containing protein [Streptomyces sp. ASQP_92]
MACAALRLGRPLVTGGVKIFHSKKRVAALALTAAALVSITAVQAGAFAPSLPVRGKGTVCLTTEAARALTTQGLTFGAVAPATGDGNCVTFPGSGSLSPNLTGGEIPLKGGMRFAGRGHRLDLTNVQIHIRLGEGYTSADAAADGGPAAKNIELFRYPVSLNRVTFTPTTVDTKGIPLSLTAAGGAAFTKAFAATPVAVGKALFTFDGHAEITNPFSGLPKP